MNLKNDLYSVQLKLRQCLIGKRYEFLNKKNSEINFETFAPKKILFVLSGLLGDSVMSAPTITAAREIWKNSCITLLGKNSNCELLADCPHIDEFYECNADPFSLRKSDEIKKLQNWLGSQDFDLAVILLGDQFAHLLAKAKIPVRIGVKNTPLESCLTNVYDIGNPRIWGANERLNALRCLGYSVGNTVPQLWVNSEAQKSGRGKLSALGLKETDKYAILHPFGSTPRQWWNLKNVTPLANELFEKHNFKTVLIGGNEVLSQVSDVDNFVINSIGKLKLSELLAVIEGSNLVITTDSGPFHIAGALRKSIVGLFRARRPEHAKQYPTAKVLFGQFADCQYLCEWDHCSNNPCNQLSRISPEEVIKILSSN